MKKLLVICIALVCLCFSGCGIIEESRTYTRGELEAMSNREIVDILEDVMSDIIGANVDYVYRYTDTELNIHGFAYIDGVLVESDECTTKEDIINQILEHYDTSVG